VGGEQDRPVASQLPQRRRHPLLRLRVEMGGGFVQAHQGRVPQQGPDKGQLLGLAGAALAERGVQSLWQRCQEVLEAEGGGGAQQIVVARGGAGQEKVLAQGAGQQRSTGVGGGPGLRPAPEAGTCTA
jgi:hypothetical protein